MKVIRLTAKMSSTSLGTKQAFWRVEILKCTDGRGSPTYKKTKKTPKNPASINCSSTKKFDFTIYSAQYQSIHKIWRHFCERVLRRYCLKQT